MITGVGVYASAWASQCVRCRAPIGAGVVRPWLVLSAPLCASCTVGLGLGDVEGVVSAIVRMEGVRLPYPLDRAALARLAHAARQHAAARLHAAAAVLLDDPAEADGEGGEPS